MRIPVYQMAYGQNQKGIDGLVFASELSDYQNQSVLYSFPLTERLHNFHHLIDYLEFNQIYFPFLLGEKEIELKAKIEFPELVFDVPGTNFSVRFEIDGTNLRPWPYFSPRKRNFKYSQKYVGEETNIIPQNLGFVTLLPIDLYEMDELYIEHKGVFVGLTPNFGNKEQLKFKE